VKTFIFDLDGTLSESKRPIDAAMAQQLRRLLVHGVVGIISGAHWEQFQTQVVAPLGAHERLTLAPVTGAQIWRYIDGAWKLVAESPVRVDFERVVAAFTEAFARLGYVEEPAVGDRFEDRRFQVTWSALGQRAPGHLKRDWDPDFSRRRQMIEVLRELLPPELIIRAGGATSIDVAAYEKDLGIRAILASWADRGATVSDTVYMGDALFPGGNDWAATTTGVRCVRTDGVRTTSALIDDLVAGRPVPDLRDAPP